jgi:hypothetical protein
MYQKRMKKKVKKNVGCSKKKMEKKRVKNNLNDQIKGLFKQQILYYDSIPWRHFVLASSFL